MHFGACVLLAVIAISGCKKPVAENVLARVGDREIRIDEFSSLVETRQRTSPVPVDAARLLDELVARETLVQAARKAGFEDDREVREQIRDILAAKVKERVLAPQLEAATVSDAEVQKAYEARRAEFTTPERAHLAVLFLQAPAGDAAAVRQRLENAQSQIRQVSLKGEQSFGALAVEYSEDQETRYRGGDLGWVERGRHPQRIEPAVIETGFALTEPGTISDVIRGERGFYLVKLVERQGPSVAPLEKVEPAIRAGLLREKREQIEAKFVAKIRETVPVEVHPERLPASVPASAPAASLPPKLP
jgi:parvulin-like peptidyl-prolyl isomerase